VSVSVGLALALVLGAAGVVLAQEAVAANDTIKKLLQKRLEIVIEIHTLLVEGYKVGEVEFRQVAEARMLMLSAQLDLCETKKERVKVHHETVEAAKELLRIVTDLAKAEEVGQVDVLKAKAQLLEAQIALERLKASK